VAIGDKFSTVMDWEKGVAGGIATLDGNGVLSQTQRPTPADIGALALPSSLGADASLDEVLDPGMHTGTFSSADAATACGAPMYAVCYSLLVERTGLWNGNGAKQTFTSHWEGSRPFIRTQVASGSTRVWTDWVEVYTSGNLTFHPANIELTPPSTYGNGGFIDFHHPQGESTDYTSRIIEQSPGRLVISAPNGVQLNHQLVLPGNQYYEVPTEEEAPLESALELNNSDITGLNALYFKDATTGCEGINFTRNATMYDTLNASAGKLYFNPGRNLNENGTPYEVYHAGNAGVGGALPVQNTTVSLLDGFTLQAGLYECHDTNKTILGTTSKYWYVLSMPSSDKKQAAFQVWMPYAWAIGGTARLFLRKQTANETWGDFCEVYTTANNGGVYTGTYTGNANSTQEISLGFQPMAVIVSYANGIGLAFPNAQYSTTSGTLIQVTAAGFTAGVDCNTNGVTYKYIAWR